MSHIYSICTRIWKGPKGLKYIILFASEHLLVYFSIYIFTSVKIASHSLHLCLFHMESGTKGEGIQFLSIGFHAVVIFCLNTYSRTFFLKYFSLHLLFYKWAGCKYNHPYLFMTIYLFMPKLVKSEKACCFHQMY